MSWNGWKTAKGTLRGRFWLCLVAACAPISEGGPFVRAVHDYFGTLASSDAEDPHQEAHRAVARSGVRCR